MKQEKLLKVIFPILFGSIFILLIIARLLYPDHVDPGDDYNDWWDAISNLGNMENNTVGFWFFQIAMVVSGVAIIPAILYFHPKISLAKKFNPRMGTFFMLLGVVGFLLTGFIPDNLLDVEKLHEISAGVGFLGVAIGCMFYFFAIKVQKLEINKKWFNIMIAVWWTGILLTGIFYAVATLYYDPLYDLGWFGYEWGIAGVPVIFSFGLWERVMYCIMFLALWANTKMISERIDKDQ